MIQYTIEKVGDSWAIMHGLKTLVLCLTLDKAHERLKELTRRNHDLSID